MAGIPTECYGRISRHNTVAAQRRILTVFPVYFLRHPAASREFSRALTCPRRYAPYLITYCSVAQACFCGVGQMWSFFPCT